MDIVLNLIEEINEKHFDIQRNYYSNWKTLAKLRNLLFKDNQFSIKRHQHYLFKFNIFTDFKKLF